MVQRIDLNRQSVSVCFENGVFSDDRSACGSVCAVCALWILFVLFCVMFGGCAEDSGRKPDPGDGGVDSTVVEICGDGIIAGEEECDDGNRLDGDGCSPVCTVEQGWSCEGEPSVCENLCGDGVIDSGEQCDGDLLGGNDCTTITGGYTGGTLKCSPSCLFDTTECILPDCGNGVVDSEEECDEGEANSLNGECLPNCKLATCGDGYHWEDGEECDDGDTSNTNGCLNDCNLATCGDGYVWVGEEDCDDGDLNSDTEPDACRTDCRLPRCGDGVEDTGEECDHGDQNSDTQPDVCRVDCRLPWCGDGVVDTGEDCEDGNSVSGDGCEPDCTYTCEPGEEVSCGSCGTAVCQPDRTLGECVEFCDGRECGPDICGGSCGACPDQYSCDSQGGCYLDSSCSSPSMPPATSFGFNYAPQGHLCKWVGTEYPLVEDIFEQDLDVMASLGTRVVRIMLLPYCLGVKIEENGGPHNWVTDELDAVTANLPTIINRFAAHGMSVVLAFGPNALYWNGPNAETKWWEYMYGPSGWSDFVMDMVDWSNFVVEVVEPSSACSNVLYYDLHNEVDYYVNGMSSLVTAQFSDILVPSWKRGISILRVQQASQLASDLQTSGASLEFLEFHSYPDRNHHTDISGVKSTLTSHFPGVMMVLGEYGSIFCENGQDEDGGLSTVMSVMDGAESADMSMALHWMLWDRVDGTSCADAERVGLGFEIDYPRDSFGAVAQRLSKVQNSDFETNMANWFTGGTTANVEMQRLGPSDTDAATNNYYGRMRMTAPGTYWFCNTWFPVFGDRLAVAGYLRHSSSKLGSLSIGVHFGDDHEEISTSSATLNMPPATWRFQNIQLGLQGESIEIPSEATRAFICFTTTASGTVNASSPAYIDLDAISAHDYTPQ